MEDSLLPIEIREIFAKKERSWIDFGTCWNWSIKQDWWNAFLFWVMHGEYYLGQHEEDWDDQMEWEMAVEQKLINPEKLANKLFQFLKGKDKS